MVSQERMLPVIFKSIEYKPERSFSTNTSRVHHHFLTFLAMDLFLLMACLIITTLMRTLITILLIIDDDLKVRSTINNNIILTIVLLCQHFPLMEDTLVTTLLEVYLLDIPTTAISTLQHLWEQALTITLLLHIILDQLLSLVVLLTIMRAKSLQNTLMLSHQPLLLVVLHGEASQPLLE